jgi:molybdenum cofactor guanylyltransferase
MDFPEDVVGVLLAGGRSSRMGGGDKCLRPIGGRPILARIIERLQPQVSDLVINANGEPSRFAPFGLPVVCDSVAGFAGPLAGVHAGLVWVKSNCPDVGYGVTVATDTPFFPTDLVQRFLAERKERPMLLVARSDAGLHPVIGLWPVGIASELEESLKRGERKVGAWTKEHGAVELFFEAIEMGGRRIDPFFNINQPRELAEADALIHEEAQ